jgi:hypothetical protein
LSAESLLQDVSDHTASQGFADDATIVLIQSS